MNIFVIVGCALTLVDQFMVFTIGRFLYGIACGGFSFFCPKYISEVAPNEVKGPAGSLTQICVCFGILVPYTFGVIFNAPDKDDKNYDEDKYKDYKPDTELYILFILPLGLAALQCFLMFTVFRYDTPPMLKQK
jgi:MFS family permease